MGYNYAAGVCLIALLVSQTAADLEIAPYTVVEDYGTWEVREMPALRWISTDAWDLMPHDGPEHDKAFWRLFGYIDGGNDAGVKIPMTAPVSLQITPGEGPNCESNYTMSFFIPMDMQETAPQPLDASLYIEDRPALRVAAMRFGGFPTDVQFSVQAAELYELAAAEGLAVSDIPLWTAGYDGPAVIINRRNEVWLEIN